jgi:hypothetical protein
MLSGASSSHKTHLRFSTKKFLAFVLWYSVGLESGAKRFFCLGKNVDFQIHVKGGGASGAFINAIYTFLVEYLSPPHGKIYLSCSFELSTLRLFRSCASSSNCGAAIIDRGRFNILNIFINVTFLGE